MELERFTKGFAFGVVATVLMSALMILGTVTGVSPMPKPIPPDIVGKWAVFLSPAWVMVLAVFATLAYGGFWAGFVSVAWRRVTFWHGLALGLVLWLAMSVTFLPWLGWGEFGAAASAKIPVATLILHLVYGITFGVLMDFRTTPARVREDPGGDARFRETEVPSTP